MPKRKESPAKRLAALETSIKQLTAEIGRLQRRLERQESAAVASAKRMETRMEREAVLMAALGLDERSRKGDRGYLDEVGKSVLRLEEFFFKNSERVERILVTLKNHRELLARMNAAYFRAGEKEKIKTELDIMKNTLSILALAGTELDTSILKDIKSLEESLTAKEVDFAELKKSKERLGKKFDGELKRFDIEAIYLKRKNIPGYG